jgi:hypothetical protein
MIDASRVISLGYIASAALVIDACGIKGPPRPPSAAIAPTSIDGGAPRAQRSRFGFDYVAAAPVIEDGKIVLLWRSTRVIARNTFVLLEEHDAHVTDNTRGDRGCGRRRVLARLRALPEVRWRAPSSTRGATFRLLDEGGVALSEGIRVGAANLGAPR